MTIPGTAVAGWLLLVLYFVVRQLLPATGPAEFAYAPFSPVFHIFSPMRGFTVEQLVSHVLRVALLGPGLLLLSIGLSRALQSSVADLPTFGRLHLWACSLSLAVTAYAMCVILRGRAIVDDEVTYAQMARSFLRGQLGEPAYRGTIIDLFEVSTRVGVTGKYLFGEPIVQMLGVLVGVPALLHLALNAVTLFALYTSVRLFWPDGRVAAWSCTLLALSPAFMLCAATGQSQPSALACVALGLLGYSYVVRREQAWGGTLSGAAVAFGTAVRVQVMVPVGIVLGVAFLLHAMRTRRFAAIAGFAALSLFGLAAIAAYNIKLSGNPWTLPWFLQPMGMERYGFGHVWDKLPFEHTPLGGLQNLLVAAVRMNAWWLGWPLALPFVLRRKPLGRVLRGAPIFLAVSLAIIVFEFGYYSPGVSDVGPLYHFELLLCLSVLGALVLSELEGTRPRLAAAGFVVHVLLGTGSFVCEESARLGRLVEAIHQEPERVLAALPPRTLLLVATDCDDVVPVGWVHRSFARVTHDPDAPVVSYGRPSPAVLDEFIAHFADRQCFYLHRSDDHRLQTTECSAARELLMRPLMDDTRSCTYLASTAQRLGWYNPFQ